MGINHMRNSIRVLGLIIVIYAICFCLIPFINGIKSICINIAILKEAIFWDNAFQLFFHLICGIGILKLNKIARLAWLIYATYILLINVPEIQIIIQGKFFKFSDAPLWYWIKNYTLFLLIIYSLVFLNLPKVKEYFKK